MVMIDLIMYYSVHPASGKWQFHPYINLMMR